jgi:tRNA(His) 5'-end guanylyltransferase
MTSLIMNSNNSNETINNEKTIIENRLNIKSFEEGMQVYEKTSMTSHIPNNRPFIIRIKTNAYTKMTALINAKHNRTLKSPFDKTYSIVMIKTAQAFLKDNIFKPRSIYTHSDEINLLFHASQSKIYNGDIQKFVSLISSKATTFFRKYFSIHFSDDKVINYSQDVYFNIEQNMPTFESKVIYFPEDKEYEIVNYFMWRATKIRDYIQDYSLSILTQKGIENMKKDELKVFYKTISDIDIHQDAPFYLRYGIFMKKSITKACFVESDGNDIDIVNTIIHFWSMKFTYTEEILEQLMSKYFIKDAWKQISHEDTTAIWHQYDEDEFEIESQNYINRQKYINHLSKYGKNLIYKQTHDTQSDFSEFYKAIPFWSFYMVIIHFANFITGSPLIKMLSEAVCYGMLFSSLICFISSQSKVHGFYNHLCIVGFWTILICSFMINTFVSYLLSSEVLKIAAIVIIYYGYYFTIGSGIYLYSYIKSLPLRA